MEDTNWVARFGDLAGIGYATPADLDRRKLPHHDAKPELVTFSYAGKRDGSLMWKMPDGETSQSPASAWFSSEDPRNLLTTEVLRRLYEALELPGVASDYHFALLRAYDILWSRRRSEPEVLPEFERLCLLDMKLVELRPDIIRMPVQNEEFTARVPAFHYLSFLYEQEGAIEDAIEVAKRAAAAGQGSGDLDHLQERLASLQEEDHA